MDPELDISSHHVPLFMYLSGSGTMIKALGLRSEQSSPNAEKPFRASASTSGIIYMLLDRTRMPL